MSISDKNYICNITEYYSKHNKRLLQQKEQNNNSAQTISQSKEYISQISSTLNLMGVKTSKLQNLQVSTISNLVNIYESLDEFVKSSTQISYSFFLYPPETNYNQDLSTYSNLLKQTLQMTYFKAKYDFIDYLLYIKNAVPLGGDNSLQKVIPIFLGGTTIRTDDRAANIYLDLNNQGIVYGIIVFAENATKPQAVQLANGVDGNGKKPVGFSTVKNTLDDRGNLKTVSLSFHNLTNNVKMTIFYAPGLIVPDGKDPIISENVKSVNVTSKSITNTTGKRVLIGDEEL